MHRLSSAFVLAYHGCDRKIGEKILNGESFSFSENDYDWLGHGIYFWETNPKRGLEWARQLQARKRENPITEPFVLGAVIDLGFCLDLLSSSGTSLVKAAYADFEAYVKASNVIMPSNSGGEDSIFRRLDCAVVNHIHTTRKTLNEPEFETVRAVFFEGARLYEKSGFRERSHIQICVRKAANIKGVFRVPDEQLGV